jgi:hypothetical protein
MAVQTPNSREGQPGSRQVLATDQVLMLTRVVAIVIFPVLILGFVLLYFLPTETEAHFAWTINPEMTPLIMGSGYLAGAYYFIRVATGRKWSRVALTNPAVSVFATIMMVATVIHWEPFNHTHWAFYTWVTLYTVAPPIVLAMWWINRKHDPGLTDYSGPLVPGWARVALGLSGLGALTFGIVLLIWPQVGVDSWPWTLSPLTARILAGWFMLSGTASLILAPDRRWLTWRMPFETTVIWAVLVIIGIARAWHNFDSGSAGTWTFVIGVGMVILGFTAFYLYMEKQVSEEDSGIARVISAD